MLHWVLSPAPSCGTGSPPLTPAAALGHSPLEVTPWPGASPLPVQLQKLAQIPSQPSCPQALALSPCSTRSHGPALAPVTGSGSAWPGLGLAEFGPVPLLSCRSPAEQLQSTEPHWDQPSQPSVRVTGQAWFPALPPLAPATPIGFPGCCGLGLPALSAVPADSEAAPGAETLNGAEPLLPHPLPQCQPAVPCLSAPHRARVTPSCGCPEHKGGTEQRGPNQLLY